MERYGRTNGRNCGVATMVLIDEQNWPLILVRWEAPVSAMDVGFYRDSLLSWTTRAPRFAVLAIQPPMVATRSRDDEPDFG